jgi:hypothetical protein
MTRHRFRLLVSLFVLLLGACSEERSPEIKSASGLDQFETLPGMRSAHLPGLRDELAKLESERATAYQLTGNHPFILTALHATAENTDPANRRPSPPPVFAPQLQSSLIKKLDDLYPAGPLEFSFNALRAAIQLKDRYELQRQRIHRIIADLKHGFGIQLTQGMAADTSFTDVVTIALRFDAIVAAEMLYHDDLSGAIVILKEMTASIESLASEKHIVPRIAAVHRRGEALRVMEAIATHPKATLETHRRLSALINDQLADWPTDQAVWIGERAMGMQTYELIRDGYLLSILDDKERSRLKREVGLKRLGKQVAANLDRDELFYLQSMRRAIDACQRPYYRRQRVFPDVENKLESLSESLAYPLVADLILWQDVQEGHRLQALDRARCEAWSIALAVSVGAPDSPYIINPLTGHRYILDPRPDKIIVDGIDPNHEVSPIIIPRKSASPPRI